MTAQTKIEAPTGLALLRVPFGPNHISKLPKPTKAQTDAVRANFKVGIRCKLCGAWHHPDVVHLDYVGHAAATDRLLDADPHWTWDPVPDPASLGLPTVPGGMWIKLTVDGVSRYGFGSADGKTGGDAIKEIIGDAIRNAGMRFGLALDLWSKGDLHADEDAIDEPAPQRPTAIINDAQWGLLQQLLEKTNSDVKRFCQAYDVKSVRDLPMVSFADAKAKLATKLKKLVDEQTKLKNAEQQVRIDVETQRQQSAEFAGVTEADCPF